MLLVDKRHALLQLRDLEVSAVAAIRLLSRRFNALATPVAYRTLVLHHRLVAPSAPCHCSNVFRNISAYTNHIIVRSDLEPEGVARLINSVERLQSLRWVDTL